MSIEKALAELCDYAASLYRRGYAFGSTGNLSLRDGETVWITPTGSSLGNIRPEEMAHVGMDGKPLNANKPSKEYPFHLAAYRSAGERAAALVHLHCTHTVALSCLETIDEAEPMPVFTPYFLMRVAPLAIVPYFRPGSEQLADAIGEAAVAHDCLLLRNHGSVCLGKTLNEAADRAEELEETARLHFLLRGEKLRYLGSAEREDINRTFRNR